MKKDEIGLRCESGHDTVCRNALFPGFTARSETVAGVIRAKGFEVGILP